MKWQKRRALERERLTLFRKSAYHAPMLTLAERAERQAALVERYRAGDMHTINFRGMLGTLGLTATEIESLVNEHRPVALKNNRFA